VPVSIELALAHDEFVVEQGQLLGKPPHAELGALGQFELGHLNLSRLVVSRAGEDEQAGLRDRIAGLGLLSAP
jgi:hypothetical protein